MKSPGPLIAGRPLRASWGRAVDDNIQGLWAAAGNRPIAKPVFPRSPGSQPPKQFSVTCDTDAIVYVRLGKIWWSNVPIELIVGDVVSGGLSITMDGSFYYVDCSSAWETGLLKHLAMKIVLGNVRQASLEVSDTDNIQDDSMAETVRWPLASILGTVFPVPSRGEDPSSEVFAVSVAGIAHEGIIKLTGVPAPP